MCFKYKELKKYNTFNLNAKAKEIYSVYSIDEILIFWKYAKLKKLPIILLGNGSNIVFISDFDGIVLLNKIKSLAINESAKKWYIHVSSGNNWHQLIQTLNKKGIYGLENMALIPGSVGAAPIQNIGAYGMEFKDVCNYVDIINLNNGNRYRLNTNECKFKYRDSIFNSKYKENFAITSVGLVLSKRWKPILTCDSLKHLKKKNN